MTSPFEAPGGERRTETPEEKAIRLAGNLTLQPIGGNEPNGEPVKTDTVTGSAPITDGTSASEARERKETKREKFVKAMDRLAPHYEGEPDAWLIDEASIGTWADLDAVRALRSIRKPEVVMFSNVMLSEPYSLVLEVIGNTTLRKAISEHFTQDPQNSSVPISADGATLKIQLIDKNGRIAVSGELNADYEYEAYSDTNPLNALSAGRVRGESKTNEVYDVVLRIERTNPVV